MGKKEKANGRGKNIFFNNRTAKKSSYLSLVLLLLRVHDKEMSDEVVNNITQHIHSLSVARFMKDKIKLFSFFFFC